MVTIPKRASIRSLASTLKHNINRFDLECSTRGSICMHYTILALGLFLISAPAHAQVAGQPCDQFGATHLSLDQTSVLGCLYTAAWPAGSVGTPPSTEWKLETVSSSGGVTGGCAGSWAGSTMFIGYTWGVGCQPVGTVIAGNPYPYANPASNGYVCTETGAMSNGGGGTGASFFQCFQ
jgi:hypothetical protein